MVFFFSLSIVLSLELFFLELALALDLSFAGSYSFNLHPLLFIHSSS